MVGWMWQFDSYQTVGSVFLMVPEPTWYNDNMLLEGTVRVLPDLDDPFNDAYICSYIGGNGYYSCNTPLRG